MADFGDEASNVEPDSGSEAEVNKLHLEVKTLSDGQEIDSCDDANVTHITLTALKEDPCTGESEDDASATMPVRPTPSLRAHSVTRRAARRALTHLTTVIADEREGNSDSDYEPAADDVTSTKKILSQLSSVAAERKKRKLTPARAPVKAPASSERRKARYCECCNHHYKSRDEFLYHTLVILGPTSSRVMFKCPDCCRCVGSINALNKHRLKEHKHRPPTPPPASPPPSPPPSPEVKVTSEKKPKGAAKAVPGSMKQICPICNDVFDSRIKFSTHLDAHNVLRDLNLSDHAKGRKVKTSSQKHEQSDNHITTADEQSDDAGVVESSNASSMRLPQDDYACRWCGKQYKGRLCLSKHLLTCTENSGSQTDANPLKCTKCGEVHASQKELKEHMKTEHDVDAPKYQCHVCGEVFSDARVLRQHARTHSSETLTLLKCQRCPRSFKDRAQLRKHEMLHDNIRKYKCHECARTFVKPTQLRDHLVTHMKKKKSFACKFCDVNFNSVDAVTAHEASHTEDKPYRCQYCSVETFADVTERDQHELSHTSDRPHKCRICEETFIRKSSLYTHLLSHKTQFDCRRCEIKFTTVHELREHNSTHHDATNEFACEICAKLFGDERKLRAHELIHTEKEARVCAVCSKRFVTAAELSVHKQQHSPTRPHICEYCPRAFNQKADLVRHRQLHTGERTVTCHLCGKGFIRKHELEIHLLLHAGVKPHKCTQCGVAFTRKHHLNKHMRLHTGEKPYICDYCGKAFAERYNMLTHRITHTGVKPYQCPLCHEGFVRKGHLRKHVEMAHPGMELDDRPALFVDTKKPEVDEAVLETNEMYIVENAIAPSGATVDVMNWTSASSAATANQQSMPMKAEAQMETELVAIEPEVAVETTDRYGYQISPSTRAIVTIAADGTRVIRVHRQAVPGNC